MSVLKRNIGLFTFCAAAIIAAVVLAVFINNFASEAENFETKVKEQREFFRELKNRAVPINQANLEVLSQNYDLVSNELAGLRAGLHQESQIPVQEVSGVEAKNILTRSARDMRQELEATGILVSEAAASFSFNDILAAEGLPDKETEVPILMKQLKIIQEIVRLTSDAYVNQVLDIQRPTRLQDAEREFFTVMPFKVEVQGKVSAVKKLVTSLQADAAYLFAVQNLKISSANNAGTLLSEEAGAEWRKMQERRRETGTDRPSVPAFIEEGEYEPGMGPGMRGPRGDRPPAENEEATIPPRDARKIGLDNMVRISMRVDFLQFKEPTRE